MKIEALHHVQLAMPAGGEAQARSFYAELLGIQEQAKPAELAARGGVWFERGDLRVHLGVEADFSPARKAHPALLIADFQQCLDELADADYPFQESSLLNGARRAFVDDPFGNRVELLEDKRPRCGFVVLYQWRLDEQRVDEFEQAWAEMTHLIRDQLGGLGSRLHRGEADTWMAYAQWPSRAAWEESQQQPSLDPELSAKMQAAIVERLPTRTFLPHADLWEPNPIAPKPAH